MKQFFKKFLEKKIKWKIILFFFVFFLFFPTPLLAKYDPSVIEVDNYKQLLEAEDINLAQWTLYNMNFIIKTLNRIITGVPRLEKEEANNPGAIGFFASLIEQIYQNKPVSSLQYFADLGEKLSLTKPAYAQGEGWVKLSSVLKIWKGLRNVTYLFFTIIFVALGFMIMFRKKLDPQTTISIQNAIPKIVISLVLVTFSFAICALIVDIIFLGNKLLTEIFKDLLYTTGLPNPPPDDVFTYQPNKDIFTVIGRITGRLVNKVGGPPVLGCLASFFEALTKMFGGEFSDIFNFIIGIIILTTLIKLFLSLLTRYTMIILYTIFSPFIILWGSLPGQQDHIANFFRSFIGNAIIFPATLLMLNIADYLFTVGPTFNPPLESIPPLNLPGGGFTPQMIAGFLGLGVIIATAKLPEMIDDALKTKPMIAPTMGGETANILRKIPVLGSFVQ